MNVLTIVGRLGQDARTNKVGGTSVANFSVAAKAGYGEREQTVWVDCALWGQRAEGKLVDYLKKGQQVCVSGEMGTREHDGKTYITLRVNELTLCGGRDAQQDDKEPLPEWGAKSNDQFQSQGKAPGGDYAAAKGGTTQRKPIAPASMDEIEEDIPF